MIGLTLFSLPPSLPLALSRSLSLSLALSLSLCLLTQDPGALSELDAGGRDV